MQNFNQNFSAFRNQFMQQGISPEQQVANLLNSGQMTQDQFNEFRQIANMLTGHKN
jgi:replicative DNA helicase